jgi:hypothetical protein
MLRTNLMKSLTGCVWLLAIPCILFSSAKSNPSARREEISDITGQYHFLSPDDTLAVLEEEGKLKGYIDVTQSDEESDTVLSFAITTGSRKKDRIEFKTSKIHQRYYRFAGAVERGQGQREDDPDYLRLVGDLEVVTAKGGPGEDAVQRLHVVLKSLGKGERAEN